jgi:acyl phosphate:glycerol-3-phosphate acyltransferase
MKFLFAAIFAYLLGSVNFAIVLFRLLGKEDPRESFSGNAGTTNVYRLAGPVWAAVVLLLDVARAIIIGLIAKHGLTPGQVPWAGLALVMGNRYPIFHGFQGGKGVANYLGFSVVITPAGAAVSAVAWVLVYVVKRIPFLASFAMILVLAFGTMAACGFKTGAMAGTLVTVLFIANNHRKNIADFFQNKTGEEKAERDDE